MSATNSEDRWKKFVLVGNVLKKSVQLAKVVVARGFPVPEVIVERRLRRARSQPHTTRGDSCCRRHRLGGEEGGFGEGRGEGVSATFRPNVVEIVIYKFEFESINLNF